MHAIVHCLALLLHALPAAALSSRATASSALAAARSVPVAKCLGSVQLPYPRLTDANAESTLTEIVSWHSWLDGGHLNALHSTARQHAQAQRGDCGFAAAGARAPPEARRVMPGGRARRACSDRSAPAQRG